jgi:hypothetical protein
MRIYISKGNKKMKKNSGFYLFALPAIITCIGCTSECVKRCYARKAERMYRKTRDARLKNLLASWEDNFVEEMVKAIKKAIGKRTGDIYFRIHEGGDFYSQEYYNKIVEVVKSFPDVKFLAFTKSFQLDFSDCPNNLNLVMSIFPDTKESVPQGYARAYAGNCNMEGNNYVKECSGQCHECKECWSLGRKEAVHFKIH